MKLFFGKPLVTYILKTALESAVLDRIIVTSDSREVLNMAEEYGSKKLSFLKRPEEISGDNSPAINYVNHTIEYLNLQREHYDIIVILQPSSPLTQVEDIEGTIKLLINSNADSAVSVVRLDHSINPVKMKTMKGDRLLPFIEDENGRMSQNELPEIYVRNCSVYASRIGVIKKGQIIGEDCRGYIMPRERSVDINDNLDFNFAEFLYERKLKNN